MDLSKPTCLQGIYDFSGCGLDSPVAMQGATYTVPEDRRAQLVYFRAGNSSSSLINVVLLRDGNPLRYFPVGAQASQHVALAVMEDLNPDCVIELQIAAPEKSAGVLVVDVGFVEI